MSSYERLVLAGCLVAAAWLSGCRQAGPSRGASRPAKAGSTSPAAATSAPAATAGDEPSYTTAPATTSAAAPAPQADRSIAIMKTSQGDLTIHPINHSAVRFAFGGKQYYVDPSGQADWRAMPKADVILITHEHRDHLDPKVIETIRQADTVIYASAAAVKAAGFGQTIEVGQTKRIGGITVQAVAAYNMHPDRLRYHPKARKDNGYVLTFGDKRVYVAGDTEGTPEMKALKDIDVAFLPINLPYTMLPAAAAEAAKAFRPKVLYPYHQGRSDPQEVKRLLADEKDIEVRVLPLP